MRNGNSKALTALLFAELAASVGREVITEPIADIAPSGPNYTRYKKHRRRTESTARMAGNRIERRRTRKKLARKSRQRNRK